MPRLLPVAHMFEPRPVGGPTYLDIVSFRGSCAGAQGLFESPFPTGNLRHVVAVTSDVLLVFDQLLMNRLLEVGSARTKLRQTIDYVLHQMEPVQVVEHDHVEGRRSRAFFLVAAHME